MASFLFSKFLIQFLIFIEELVHEMPLIGQHTFGSSDGSSGIIGSLEFRSGVLYTYSLIGLDGC